MPGPATTSGCTGLTATSRITFTRRDGQPLTSAALGYMARPCGRQRHSPVLDGYHRAEPVMQLLLSPYWRSR